MVVEDKNAQNIESFSSGIEINNITFSYEDENVLNRRSKLKNPKR